MMEKLERKDNRGQVWKQKGIIEAFLKYQI